jgi:hypothetical protein
MGIETGWLRHPLLKRIGRFDLFFGCRPLRTAARSMQAADFKSQIRQNVRLDQQVVAAVIQPAQPLEHLGAEGLQHQLPDLFGKIEQADSATASLSEPLRAKGVVTLFELSALRQECQALIQGMDRLMELRIGALNHVANDDLFIEHMFIHQ